MHRATVTFVLGSIIAANISEFSFEENLVKIGGHIDLTCVIVGFESMNVVTRFIKHINGVDSEFLSSNRFKEKGTTEQLERYKMKYVKLGLETYKFILTIEGG